MKEDQTLECLSMEEDRTSEVVEINSEKEADLNFGNRLQSILSILDVRLRKKFLTQEQTSTNFPALDIGSGYAFFPIAYAHHFPSLDWYSTDYVGEPEEPVFTEGKLCDTLSYLHWFLVEANAGVPARPVLFTDSKGKQVCEGDMVKLHGLSNESWNIINGVAKSIDPKDPTRVAVHPFPRRSPMSLKKMNLNKVVIRKQQNIHHDPAVLQGLIDRTRLVDVLDTKTWSNVAELNGRCAVVTATSMLTCLGFREPEFWKDCLKLASKLLAPGGYFLQYDTAKFGKFAHGKTMKDFVQDHGLGLILEGRKEEPPCGHGKMYILLWRKEEGE